LKESDESQEEVDTPDGQGRGPVRHDSESDEAERRDLGAGSDVEAETGEWDEQEPREAEWVEADVADGEWDPQDDLDAERTVGDAAPRGAAISGWRRATKILYPLGILLALGVGFGLGRTSVRQRVIFSGAMSGLEDRPFQGPADAPVTIVEYTDYDCPFCKRYHAEIYPQLLQEYAGKVRYFVRHFPLQQLHPRAPNAARAAVCAEAQDRFWSYHELLFFRGNAPDDEGLVAYATELGLDEEQFSGCMDDAETDAAVMADLQRGAAYGVRGTPAFFINGRVIFGAQRMEVFRQTMDAALREAGAL
jgi:predicted DsbA family dithiol-disulfide isomerase